MPEALIVVDSLASVKYVSPGAQRFGIVEDHAMTLAEIRDILRLVSTDSVVRERELSIPLDRAARAAAKNTDGKGIEAGKFRPSDTLYLHVRVGQISDDLFAIFISDMSEQHRFEIMRRDFVTNVSHELKTPAGAISLLAETIGDAADDPDMVKYFAGRVSKESERLTELVHRLIDLQKAQSAAAVLNAERLSVLALVREAIVENQVNAESKHISMVLSLNGKQKLVHVEGAENAVDRDDVFINADHETIKTAGEELGGERHQLFSGTHHSRGRCRQWRWQGLDSCRRSGHRYSGILVGSYFRAILPCRSRALPRNRGYRIGLGHHQALRAGLRRHYRRVVA